MGPGRTGRASPLWITAVHGLYDAANDCRWREALDVDGTFMSPTDTVAVLCFGGGGAVNAMAEKSLAAVFWSRPQAGAAPTAAPGAPGPDAANKDNLWRLREM